MFCLYELVMMLDGVDICQQREQTWRQREQTCRADAGNKADLFFFLFGSAFGIALVLLAYFLVSAIEGCWEKWGAFLKQRRQQERQRQQQQLQQQQQPTQQQDGHMIRKDNGRLFSLGTQSIDRP